MQALQTLRSIEIVKTACRRVYLPRFDPFSLNDEEFRKRYRYSKQTARAIINLIQHELGLDRKGFRTSPELQVLTAIRFWGGEAQEKYVANAHGLSKVTVKRICIRVARALARHASRYIKMPVSVIEQQQLIQEFKQISGFQCVIGCIDCRRIKIKKLGTSNYFILNVQVTCDASLRIRDIVTSWKKSADDTQVFKESALRELFEAGEFQGKLLGDAKYHNEPCIFTPVLNPQTIEEEKYNQVHFNTRNIVVQGIDMWIQRFQCLHHGISVKYGYAKTTIVALAVLHNIAIENNEICIDNI